MHIPHPNRLTDWDKWWQIQGHCGDHYYCCSCRNWQSNICSNIKSKKVGDTISWFKAPPSYTASCMVMCIKILNFYAFFNYSSKTFVSSLKLQFAAHLLGKCGDRLFTSEQGCVGSLSNLGDFEISQMPCFAKICKCPPCGQSWQISTWLWRESVIVILKIAPHVYRQCPWVGGGLSVLNCSEVYDR